MSLLTRAVRRPAPFPSHLLKSHNAASRPISTAVIATSEASDWLAFPVACLLDSIHVYSGLPWYAALPLSAVVIRTCLVYPAFQKPARTTQVRRAQIQPLVDARMSYTMRDGTNESRPKTKMDKYMAMFRERWRIERDLFPSSPNFPVVNKLGSFLVLILVSGSLRKLMGAKEGLLSLLLGPLSRLLPDLPEPSVAQAQVSLDPPRSTTTAQELLTLPSDSIAIPVDQPLASTPSPDQSDTFATVSEQTAASTPLSDLDVNPVVGAAAERLNVHDVWFDPTFLTEGFSWCSDMTVADPTLMLPFIFSSTFFASVYFAPRVAGTHATEDGKRPPPTNLQRIVMTFAALSIIPALHMPVGILIYFLSNMLISQLQSRWLAYKYPIRPAPRACKRPVRASSLD